VHLPVTYNFGPETAYEKLVASVALKKINLCGYYYNEVTGSTSTQVDPAHKVVFRLRIHCNLLVDTGGSTESPHEGL
jgi:hypothetical protein